MLKTRVIPTLLWKGPGLVKGVQFDSWRRVGTVLPAIKVYNTREVDELILLDIEATGEKREPDYDSIADVSAECFVPLTVGGGVRCVDHVFRLLRSGADKVCINSAAYEDLDLIQKVVNRFGSQCVVVSIDARRNSSGSHECFSKCGTCPANRDPGEWARNVAEAGAGEILITSIDRDGTMAGYDLELVRQVASHVAIPVIASGGAGTYQHLLEAIVEGKADAVAAASMFHYTEQTPLAAKTFLNEHGIRTRLSQAQRSET